MRRRASVHSSRPARPRTVTGTTKTPEGTTRSGLRVHQCKHRLLRNLGRLAPPGKTYCTTPSGPGDTRLSTSLKVRRRIGRSCPRLANIRPSPEFEDVINELGMRDLGQAHD